MGYIKSGVEERREHQRLNHSQQQLYVRVGGRTYRTVEWSFGGLVIEDKCGQLQTGALVRIDGLADEDTYRRASSPHPVDIRARVNRVMRDQRLVALSCLKLDDAAYRLMRIVGGDLTEVQAGQAG